MTQFAEKFTVNEDDPWYIDPKDAALVLSHAFDHLKNSQHCTHGHGFTYDFCPFANGNVRMALEIASIRAAAAERAAAQERKRKGERFALESANLARERTDLERPLPHKK